MDAVGQWVLARKEPHLLGPRSRAVVDVLATQPQLASFAAATDIASRAGVNAATVVRTARQLGFTGWPELRLEIRNRYLASLTAPEVFDEHGEQSQRADPVQSALEMDLRNVQLMAKSLDVAAVHALAAAIDNANRTVALGSGGFAALGTILAHAGSSMGFDITLERHGGTLLANTINKLRPGDALVVVNLWRLPKEVLAAARIARAHGAVTCVITDLRTSPLARAADHVVIVPSEGSSVFPSLTAGMVVVNAILATLAARAPERVHAGLESTEQLWREFGLMHDVTGVPEPVADSRAAPGGRRPARRRPPAS